MRRALIVPALVLIALVALAAWVTGSQTGARYALRLADSKLESVSFGTVEGRLAGPLRLGDVRLVIGNVRVAIDTLDLAWLPRALIQRRIAVTALRAEGVTVRIVESVPGVGTRAAAEPAVKPASFDWDIDIGELAVDRLQVVSGDRKIDIETLRFNGGMHGGVVTVDLLEVRAPDWNSSVNGRFQTTSPYAMRAAMAGDWNNPGGEKASASATLNGDANELLWTLQASGARDAAQARLELDGTVTDLTGQLNFDARAALVADPSGNLQTPAWDVVLTVSGTPVAVQVNGPLTVRQPGLGQWQLAMQLNRDGDTLRVEQFRATGPRAAQIEGRGTAGVENGAARFDARLAWQALSLPTAGALASPQGHIEISGTPDAYRILLDGNFDGGGIPPSRLAGQGSGDRNGLTLERLSASVLGGVIEAVGNIGWVDGVSVDTRGTASQLDARAVVGLFATVPGGFTGQLGGGFEVRGDTSAGDWTVQINDLNGRIQDQPLAGRADLQVRPSELRLNTIAVTLGDARVSASGGLDSSWDLNWNLSVPDLARVWPEAAGRFDSAGRVEGERRAPRVVFTADGTALRFADLRADAVHADVDAGLAANETARADLTASGLWRGKQELGEAKVNVQGPLTAHTIAVHWQNAGGSADAGLRGAFGNTGWEGNVESLNLAAGELQFALVQPASLLLSGERARTGNFCLDGNAGKICLDGGWSRRAPWDLRADVQGFQLGFVTRLLDSPVAYQGAADFTLSLAGTADSGPGGTGSLSLAPGSLSQSRSRNRVGGRLLRVEGGSANLRFDSNSLDADLDIKLATGELQGRLTLPSGLGKDAPVEGALKGEFSGLRIIPLLIPNFSGVDGRMLTNLTLSGRRDSPVLGGVVAWRDGVAQLPELGLSLTDIQVEANGDPGKMTVNGTMKSGEGTIRLEGEVLPAAGGYQGRLALQGDAFTALDRPDLRVLVSPDIEVTINPGQVAFSGSATVPYARISPVDTRQAVSSSPDVVLTGGDAKEIEARGITVVGSLQLDLGDEVTVNAYGLTGALRGSVTIETRPDGLTTGSGEINIVDGAYVAYGQRLQLERGRLQFTGGPISDPGLDLRATRLVDNITVGANVRGPIREPVVSLFSDGGLPESETLSYLLTGTSLSSLNSDQQGVVARATDSLALQSAGLLAQQLQYRLGLDELRVQTGDSNDDAQLVVGNYVAPGLFVSYGIGLFEAINTLRVRYEISTRWSLQTETGENSSADLIYTISR